MLFININYIFAIPPDDPETLSKDETPTYDWTEPIPKKVMTEFKPSIHGFHFANNFVNEVINIPDSLIPDAIYKGDFKITTKGRCGGMAYTALDYYYAKIPIPGFERADFPGAGVPPDGHPLADYIYDRLQDSFTTTTSPKYATWTLRSDEGSTLFDGVRELTDQEAIKLMEILDSGKPAVLGLIKAYNLKDIGKNHQVVAYGYQIHGNEQTFYIYDNNYPNEEVKFYWKPGDEDRKLISSTGDIWRGFFVHNYDYKKPIPFSYDRCEDVTGENCEPGETKPPLIEITKPISGTTITPNKIGVIEIEGKASDESGIKKVEISFDNNPFISAKAAGVNPNDWGTWKTSADVKDLTFLASGQHTVTAKATDFVGNMRTVLHNFCVYSGTGVSSCQR